MKSCTTKNLFFTLNFQKSWNLTLVFQSNPEVWCLDGIFLGSPRHTLQGHKVSVWKPIGLNTFFAPFPKKPNLHLKNHHRTPNETIVVSSFRRPQGRLDCMCTWDSALWWRHRCHLVRHLWHWYLGHIHP